MSFNFLYCKDNDGDNGIESTIQEKYCIKYTA